jgi:hypothetical protein
MSEVGDMSIHELLFQWANTIKIQLSVLVYYKADIVIIILSLNINHEIAEKCLVGVKQQSPINRKLKHVFWLYIYYVNLTITIITKLYDFYWKSDTHLLSFPFWFSFIAVKSCFKTFP